MNDTLSYDEQVVLEKFYSEIEKTNELNNFPISIIPSLDNISTDLHLIICTEYNAQLSLNMEYIQEKFCDGKEKTKHYLEDRITKTPNLFLYVRYYHFLYVLTKNNKYGEDAIDNYQLILLRYLSDLEYGYNILHFQNVLRLIISLTESIKYKTEDLKSQIHDYLKNSYIHYRLKTHILNSLKETKLFRIVELEYFPSLCCELAEIDSEPNFVELDLQLGLLFAKKIGDIGMQRAINERLGDYEYRNIKPYDGDKGNMVIPYLNSNSYKKIIQYYKHASNKEKLNKALIEFRTNKKNCKMLKISVPIQMQNPEDKKKFLNELTFSIINSSTKIILFELILGVNSLIIPDEYLGKYVEDNKNNITDQLFKPVRIDVNSNEMMVETDEYHRFNLYSLSLSTSLDFTFNIIMKGVENKKLSFIKVANILCKETFLGQELIFTRNGKNLSYTWFSMLDLGLRSFFDQCKLLLNDKQPDWRFSTEFLTLKFEGILRDIVGLVGGNITKIDAKGNTSQMLLDDLLRSPEITKTFNKDDINLFQYTFTSKGYNIRNNVAHSFYKPIDYTERNAVMVFLCVLRLAKFVPAISNEEGIKNTVTN